MSFSFSIKPFKLNFTNQEPYYYEKNCNQCFIPGKFLFCLRRRTKRYRKCVMKPAGPLKKIRTIPYPKLWKTGGILRFTLTQGAQSNWSAGGEKNTLGLSSFFSGYAFYKKGKHSWDNTIDLAYGFLNTTSLGSRKTDDRIDLLSKYGYDIGKNWYLSGLVNFRTQFAPGYAYPTNGPPVLTSDFLAPAYLIVSPGLNYKPNDEFSFFISPATLRWTICRRMILFQPKALMEWIPVKM